MSKQIILQELARGIDHEVKVPCVVGRSHEVNLRLSDHGVSHRHALITERDGHIWIEDLGSTNGVYVNDHRIREKTQLTLGDLLQLGKTNLIVARAKEDPGEETVVLHSLDATVGPKSDQAKLKLIYEIASDLSEDQDVTVLANKIFSRLKDIFRQDRSYLALLQEDGTLKTIAVESSADNVPLSRTIVNRLLSHGESLLLEDALTDASFKDQESVMARRIRAALCVPLIHHSQIYGVIYLDRNIPGAYTRDDLDLLTRVTFMLGPLIENARLWSELKNRCNSAMDTLRQTEARLLDMERTAAYARLAQAMAHEIRNPLTAIGGLVKRMARSGSESPEFNRCQLVVDLVKRVEAILKEVDYFVKLPRPHKKLTRVDVLIQEVISSQNSRQQGAHPPRLFLDTSRLMVPLDPDLFKKALGIILKECLVSFSKASEVTIALRCPGKEMEICIGEVHDKSRLCELFDSALDGKPWSLGLFLNMAHKIISDQGGKLFLDPEADSPWPILIKFPMTVGL